MRRALVAGHVCVDLIPELGALPRSDPGELEQIGPLAMSAGGCVSNTGGALAELDVPVQVVGDAGDDELGRTLVRLLESRGLGSDRIRLLPERSTSYTIVVQTPERDRSFWHHVGANAGFDGAAVDVHDADLLHVGYPPLLPALVADGGAQLDALLVRARTVGLTTSLDLAVLDHAHRPQVSTGRPCSGGCSRTSTSSRPASTTSARRSTPPSRAGPTSWAGAPGGSSTWVPRSRW